MTPEQLTQIEVRAKAAVEMVPPAINWLHIMTHQDIPALIAALREAWEEIESRKQWHGRMQAGFQEAVEAAKRGEFND